MPPPFPREQEFFEASRKAAEQAERERRASQTDPAMARHSGRRLRARRNLRRLGLAVSAASRRHGRRFEISVLAGRRETA